MSDFLIIAGIAAKDQSLLVKALKDMGLRKSYVIKFITISDKLLIYKEKVIDDFLESLANSVAKELPETIRLIYIPYNNSEILKEKFFPFADTQVFDEERIFYRYVISEYSNIREFANEFVKVVCKGLKLDKRPSKNHCLLLPNRNFFVGKEVFSNLLWEYYFGNQNEGIFQPIKRNKDLGCYEDSRKLAFPVTKMNEGNLRYNENGILPKHFLSGIYRLGFRWHPGYHFDVKHVSKSHINGIKFECSLNGQIEPSGTTHLNIYLNDYIRMPSK